MALQVPKSEIEAMKKKPKPVKVAVPKKYASTYTPNKSDIEQGT